MPLAHAGHWLAQLVYVAPVAIIVAFIGWQSWKDRRDGRDRDAEERDPTLDEILDGD